MVGAVEQLVKIEQYLSQAATHLSGMGGQLRPGATITRLKEVHVPLQAAVRKLALVVSDWVLRGTRSRGEDDGHDIGPALCMSGSGAGSSHFAHSVSSHECVEAPSAAERFLGGNTTEFSEKGAMGCHKGMSVGAAQAADTAGTALASKRPMTRLRPPRTGDDAANRISGYLDKSTELKAMPDKAEKELVLKLKGTERELGLLRGRVSQAEQELQETRSKANDMIAGKQTEVTALRAQLASLTQQLIRETEQRGRLEEHLGRLEASFWRVGELEREAKASTREAAIERGRVAVLEAEAALTRALARAVDNAIEDLSHTTDALEDVTAQASRVSSLPLTPGHSAFARSPKGPIQGLVQSDENGKAPDRPQVLDPQEVVRLTQSGLLAALPL